MFKNVASQKVIVYATLAGVPKTGDAANITAYIDKDGGGAVQTNDANPTELDATNMKGLYAFDMLQAESNANLLTLSPVSATSNVALEPVVIYTVTAMRGTDSAALATALATHDAKLVVVDGIVDDILEDTVLNDKWKKNRMTFDGTTMTLFDDDNVTPLLTWTLSKGTISIVGPYNRAKAT